jgi:hypothetical protein
MARKHRKTPKTLDLMEVFKKAGGVSTAEIKKAAVALDEVCTERGITPLSTPEEMTLAATEAFRRHKG